MERSDRNTLAELALDMTDYCYTANTSITLPVARRQWEQLWLILIKTSASRRAAHYFPTGPLICFGPSSNWMAPDVLCSLSLAHNRMSSGLSLILARSAFQIGKKVSAIQACQKNYTTSRYW